MGALEIRWENGRKVLNSDNGNQSFGSLHGVWVQTFAALDLPTRNIRTVLMLGLGAGSVVHILRKELHIPAPITAVEVDPVMVGLAREQFGLKYMDNVHVVQGDAIVQLHALSKRFDLVVVDLFADLDMARGVDTNGFAHGLRDRCAEGGLVCFNTVGYDAISSARCERVLVQLKKVFSTVDEFRFEGVNRVFVAR